MRKRKKRTFEVTRGQLFLVLILAAFALAAIFEAGVSVGKKRLIAAERDAIQRSGMSLTPTIPAFNGGDRTRSDHTAEERKPSRQSKAPVRASKIPMGGETPAIPPEDESTERPQTSVKDVMYTIQVGAFGLLQNAENLVAQLKSYEYKAWFKPEPSAEKMLYSVFVGGFKTRDEAKQFGGSLRDRLSFIKSYMVREIKKEDL